MTQLNRRPTGWNVPRHVSSSIRQLLPLTGLALLLTACGEGPASLPDMSERLSATLTEVTSPEAAASRSPAGVGEGFAPALRAAVADHESYRAAVAAEDAAVDRIGTAASARRPQITANATAGALRENGGVADDTTTGIAGGLNISQLVYDGGASTAEINGASAEALAARAERQLRANEVALEAARAWIDVWQLDARLGLLRSRTSEMERLLSQIERMATNGMLDRAALASARRQILDIALEETRLQADRREARVRFASFFNEDPARIDRPADLIPPAQARAAATSWRQAPALERAAAELLGARSAVNRAEAAFRPRARLQAGVTSPMDTDESTDLTVGLAVEYTFGDGGRRQSQLEAAEAQLEAAEAQLGDAWRTLEAEIDASLSRLAAIERSMPLVARQIDLSASEAATARSQIATGQADLRKLVEAEIENYRARDRHIAMQAERQILLLTIASRTGQLAARLGLERDDARG